MGNRGDQRLEQDRGVVPLGAGQTQTRPLIAIDRLLGAILLWGIGGWFAITRTAHFMLGGDPDSTYKRNGVMHVNATGLDAVAIGCFIIALGIINLALGIRDQKRIPVFWTGAVLLVATIVYGLAQAVLSVVDFVRGIG